MLPFSFVDYGVMLEINDLQYLPDGRSFLDCVGGRRFKVITSIKFGQHCVYSGLLGKIADWSQTVIDKSGNSLLKDTFAR